MNKFKIGDKIYKPKGYKFPGTVVSVFTTTTGETRIVAELEDNGMLHIFTEAQLELMPDTSEFDERQCVRLGRYETCINPHEFYYRGCTDKCKHYKKNVDVSINPE